MSELKEKIRQAKLEAIKSQKSDIKGKLATALKHWVLPAPSCIADYGHRLGGRPKPGPRILIPAYAQEWVGWQVLWIQYSPRIPHKQRKAAELHLIGDWTFLEVAKKLGLKPTSVDKYVGYALDGVASEIIVKRESPARCPRCGGRIRVSEVVRDTDGNMISLEVSCVLGCGRNVTKIADELANERGNDGMGTD